LNGDSPLNIPTAVVTHRIRLEPRVVVKVGFSEMVGGRVRDPVLRRMR